MWGKGDVGGRWWCTGMPSAIQHTRIYTHVYTHTHTQIHAQMWFGTAGIWKLIDFGTWARLGEQVMPQYTLRYAAPEVCMGCMGERSDGVWGCGGVGM